jgi:hypothetical protein
MGREDPRKIAAALVVLALALGSLGFQLVRRAHPSRPEAAYGSAAAAVTAADVTMERPFVAPPQAGVPAPAGDWGHALRRNPFLRPAPGAGTGTGTGSASGEEASPPAPRQELAVTGIRTGPRPMAIIDDRTLRVGDSVRGWMLRSIERDRVTLEKSDGRTLDLDLR